MPPGQVVVRCAGKVYIVESNDTASFHVGEAFSGKGKISRVDAMGFIHLDPK